MIMRIHEPAQLQLTDVVGAADHARPGPRLAEQRQQQGRQKRND